VTPGQAIAFVPAPGTLPEIITIEETGIAAGLVVGAVVLVAAASLIGIAQVAAALDGASNFFIALLTALEGFDDNCAECIDSKSLPQNHPRKRETVRIYRRL
jgi:hypothetical protein